MLAQTLASRLRDVEHDIIPRTRSGVLRGIKLFRAAIFCKDDLSW
jgi:hypothetical protein